jgi:hypothetical protein
MLFLSLGEFQRIFTFKVCLKAKRKERIFHKANGQDEEEISNIKMKKQNRYKR